MAFARMIDNTLARMIDEVLRPCRDSSVSTRAKVLEVPANRAHLVGLRAASPAPFKPRGFRS
jgi:hypothetical protein